MTPQQRRWFHALTQDRTENADMLDKPSMRGVQRSVVDKYSDQAHFIYELLQNADDVAATSASFVLSQDGLVFSHNGATRFSISDPATEAADSDTGALGHVNAITSIANSNKTSASIGKFGVGFKAVFQYTKTPHIYDPDFRFKIERFIVPHELAADFSGRKDEETVFWFPFNDDKKQPGECRSEIAEKLKSLIFPTLFLSTLESVSWQMDGATGWYTRRVIRTVQRHDLTARLVSLASSIGRGTKEQRLWLFSRATDHGLPYCVGFAVDEGRLSAISQPAFCFFPTKETTSLNFIVHAPFLLTDSREGIKAGENHNQAMVENLAQLAADSLPILRDEQLIDDGILDIIPYDEAQFSDPSDRSHVSFKPCYTAIKDQLKNATLLPAADGECSDRSRSYWASDTELVELFSDDQLAHLTGTKSAHWVFRSLGKKEVLNAKKNALADYIDGGDARAWNRKEPNLILASLDPESVLKKLTSHFICAQTQEWLHRLYAYLSERPSYQKHVKDKPIFIDEDDNAVPAFDANEQLVLFLPDDDIDGYTTVKKELLWNLETRKFIESFGVKKPSLRDEIYNKILPQYSSDGEGECVVDPTPHFTKFFRYFRECKHEDVDEFIELISDIDFLEYTSDDDATVARGCASEIYLPTEDLKAWFEPKADTRFLLLDAYQRVVDEKDWGRLDEFLTKLGVAKSPRVWSIKSDVSWEELRRRGWATEGRNHKFDDRVIDGCKELIEGITPARSRRLWRMVQGLTPLLNGVHSWFWYSNRSEHHPSTETDRLRTEKWIVNKSGEIVCAREATVQTLWDAYDTTSTAAEAFIKFLKIRDESLETSPLSEEQKRKIKLAEDIEQSGLSEDELRAAISEATRRKKEAADAPAGGGRGHGPATDPAERPVFGGIRARIDAVMENSGDAPDGNQDAAASPPDDGDADDFRPRPVDYSRKIDRAQDRLASEIGRLEREQELSRKADALPKYSHGWFLALLELECLANAERNADGKTVSIRFDRIERDRTSARTIVLKEPNRFIPQAVEELSGVRVDLEFRDGTQGMLHVESFTAREFSLEGKLASADELKGVDLSTVVEARIDVQNPSFLLQSLLERFRALGLDETYDMKAGLPENIEFVFGPPGTGKTTHLAERVLLPLMNGAEPKRVLVLAPTNKAADVLIARILEGMGTDRSYRNWLVRFGTSSDERVEKARVWRDRSFNIHDVSRSVVVTTVARFAYDGFAVNRGKLYELDWDVIVVDEASMISIASIVYPIYAKDPDKFIIAGDPFQIEPIVAVEQWKDENIYTLTGLSKPGSFRCPVTEPHRFNVTHLKTQFRSIPDIGEVFSRFTYDGMLSHHRRAETQRVLRLNGFDVKPLNLITFPVSRYESIYRPRRLESGTPYQTYSALFSFEFMCYLARQVAATDTGDSPFRIGIIAPYRAQANIIDKLADSWDGKPDGVSVQVGTIHGFQGDECDAIIAVLNPPPNISANPQMFLNRQNILNVAISRARDYLFIVMPDERTDNIENLRKVNLIERLVKERTGAYSESAANLLEEVILGSRTYLEDNTFSTGHQMVNVYKHAERHYEVRTDESAVDVQISIGMRAHG